MSFDRAYAFVYYKDMAEASTFYSKLLGLEEESESDWVTLYRVTSDYAIGVVQDGRGYLRATEDKPVILCLGVLDDGDIWEIYRRLTDAGVKMHTTEVELREVEGHVFFCEDSEGYIIEIVQRPRSG